MVHHVHVSGSINDIRKLIGPEAEFKIYRKTSTITAVQAPWPFVIDTREGRMFGMEGWWIAVGVRGELYPIGKAIFEETYELAEIESESGNKGDIE